MAAEEEGITPAAEVEDSDGSVKKRGGKKKLIIIIVAALLLLGGGATAYFMGLFGKKEAATEEHVTAESKKEEHAGGEEAKPTEGEGEKKEGEAGASADPGKSPYYDLPDFLVNLNSNTGQTAFIKMQISLELASADDKEEIAKKLPLLQDMFNTYLRDLRASDLSGSAGIYRLREELLARANKSLAPAKINNILFRQIMIQ